MEKTQRKIVLQRKHTCIQHFWKLQLSRQLDYRTIHGPEHTEWHSVGTPLDPQGWEGFQTLLVTRLFVLHAAPWSELVGSE